MLIKNNLTGIDGRDVPGRLGCSISSSLGLLRLRPELGPAFGDDASSAMVSCTLTCLFNT